MSDTCCWAREPGFEGEGPYETQCGKYFELNEGKLADNNMKYCCYCGKEIDACEGAAKNE